MINSKTNNNKLIQFSERVENIYEKINTDEIDISDLSVYDMINLGIYLAKKDKFTNESLNLKKRTLLSLIEELNASQ